MNKIVSGVFIKYDNTPYGGRPISWLNRYMEGIKYLKNNSYKKIIYVNEDIMTNIITYINNNIVDPEERALYYIVPYDITTIPHSDKILSLKLNEVYKKCIPNDRNVHVQYAKFHTLLQNIDDTENLFWVDAGLISGNNFPKSRLDLENIISDEFLNKKAGDGKLFAISGCLQERFSTPFITHKKDADNKIIYGDRAEHHIIGGIFGGEASIVNKKCNDYINIINDFIENDMLYMEEYIMTVDAIDNLEHYNLSTFGTWYHEDTRPESLMQPGKKSLWEAFF